MHYAEKNQDRYIVKSREKKVTGIVG